jgi:hypothetical protein
MASSNGRVGNGGLACSVVSFLVVGVVGAVSTGVEVPVVSFFSSELHAATIKIKQNKNNKRFINLIDKIRMSNDKKTNLHKKHFLKLI